nr:nucleoside triphosphatase NudI [Photorhabdus australis]
MLGIRPREFPDEETKKIWISGWYKQYNEFFSKLTEKEREKVITFDPSLTCTEIRDDIRVKTYEDGSTEEIYMIYLIFNCRAKNTKIIINDEFESYAWVMKEDLYKYDLNEATKITLKQKNLI